MWDKYGVSAWMGSENDHIHHIPRGGSRIFRMVGL